MGTIIVGLILFVIVAAAIFSIYKSQKSGSSCGCCSGCDKGSCK